MNLTQWADNCWLRSHSPSAEEIANLLVIVNRDLKDADGGISSDWRFGIAYNAALKLCSILLYASSYQAERNLQHYRTIQALPLILGDRYKSDADYLEMCRKNRNKAEDDSVGVVSEQDAEELIEFVNTLLDDVLHWLKTHHPELLEH